MKTFLKFTSIFIFILVFFTHAARADVTNGLIGWWKFDENSGTTATDSSGNGNTGTLGGKTSFVPGRFGNAVRVPSDVPYSNTYVRINTNKMPANNAPQSISLWFNRDGTGSDDFIFLDNSSNSAIGLSNTYLSAFKWGGWEIVSSFFVPSANIWHHLVYTYDGTTHTLYYDGSFFKSSNVAPNTAIPTTVRIGRSTHNCCSWGNVTIDDVRIYNRALSATEIQQLYNPLSQGNIVISATLDGEPWPTSGNSAVTYALSGPSGNISNSSIPFTYQNVTADENYTLTYLSGGPAGAIINPINPIAPASSQFLPSDASISFNLNFISGSNLCPLTPQPGRTIISFEPYEVIGSPDYADHIAGPYSFSPSLPIETYNVTLVSYDSHTGPGGSGSQNQPNEKYYLKLLGQSNNLIASTNPTSDIPNDQDFVTTLVNTNMQIASKIYKAEAWHEAYIDNSDYNSLYPICAAFDESFDYSLSNSGASVVTKTDNNVFAQNTITKTLTAGNSQDVSLTVSGAPPGVTTSISGQNCNLTCESVITFTVSPDTIIGTYPITVTGSPLNKSTEFNLVIAGDPLIVSCLASPTLVFLGDTVTLTANVSGGTPPYIYSWNGDEIPTGPSPDINPFTISYNTVGQKSASVTVTDSSSPPFQTTCPTITVRASIDPQYKEF